MEEGLIEAMAFLRDPNTNATKRRRLSRDDLAVLAAMMADKEWAKAAAEYDQAQSSGTDERLHRAEAKLAAAAARIMAAASRGRSHRINHSAEQLRELSQTWAGVWTECQHAIPFSWIERK